MSLLPLHPAQAMPEIGLPLRVLRGEPAPWPTHETSAFDQRFVAACVDAGVAPLLRHALGKASTPCDWPPNVLEQLSRAARMQAGTHMLQEREVVQVLSAFADVGISPIILKGAALAYTHYPDPALRTRCDTDLLIRPVDVMAARQALQRLGYERRPEISGSLVSFEECHLKLDGSLAHVIDLHWQVNNRQVFARALPFDEANAAAVSIPALPAARTLCPPHAMLLACMHRAGHLGANGAEGNRLIWLYDIHLLASAMTEAEWSVFTELCVTKSMRTIVLDAFACVQRALATPIAANVLHVLGQVTGNELSAAYLDSGRRSFLLVELRALPSWRTRATLLRERLFPPASYLRAKYRSSPTSGPGWLLPWWYARRAVEGVWKAARS